MASPSFAPDFASRQRISLAAIDQPCPRAWVPPVAWETRSQLASTDKLQCTSPRTWAAGRRRSLDVSTTVAIIQRFATGIQRIEALREADPDVDALITDLKRQLMGEDKNAGISADADEPCSLASFGQADLEDLAELIAARVCAYIEKRTRTPYQKSDAGET